MVPSMFPSGNGWDLSDILEPSTGVSSPGTGKLYISWTMFKISRVSKFS